MTARLAFGPALAAAIEREEEGALLRGLASTAALWFALADFDMALRKEIGATNCTTGIGAAEGATLAAALDLCAVLELCPQGRKALADLDSKPILQQSKGE